MKDVNNKIATRTGPSDVASSDALDETTREVLDDYSRKFLSFIQQEKDKVRKQAHEESEHVIAEADRKAQMTYEKAVKDAALESQRLLAHYTEQEQHLKAEAERLAHVITELSVKTQSEIDELRNRLQHNADAVAESLRQSDESIAESRARLTKDFEDSASVIARLVQSFKSDTSPRQAVAEPIRTPQPVEPARTRANREEPVVRALPKDDGNSRKPHDRTFVGTINFDIEKGTAAIFLRFKEALSKIPGLELSMAGDSSKTRASMVGFANRPIPLLVMLHQMSLVKSATAEKDTIEIVLQDVDRWIG